MSTHEIYADALSQLGELHSHGRDPVAELAYYRSVVRRTMAGKETSIRLR